jgi:hypothetical protein
LDLLEKCDETDIPLLIKVYEASATVFARDTALRDRTGRELADHPEPRVCLLLARQLGNRHEQSADHAASLLVQLGPVAESYVWPTLLASDAKAQRRACDVLRAIGTSRSVPYLEQLADSDQLGNVAKSAVLEIAAAKRTPVEPAAEPAGDAP